MRGLLIDPKRQSVVEVQADFKEIETICAVCGWGTFDIVRLENGDSLYVDDNGLAKQAQDKRFFYLGDLAPLNIVTGRALVLGKVDGEGNTLECQTPIEEMLLILLYRGDDKDLEAAVVGMEAIDPRERQQTLPVVEEKEKTEEPISPVRLAIGMAEEEKKKPAEVVAPETGEVTDAPAEGLDGPKGPDA